MKKSENKTFLKSITTRVAVNHQKLGGNKYAALVVTNAAWGGNISGMLIDVFSLDPSEKSVFRLIF